MQHNTSDGDWPMYTVKRSLFYYDPEAQPDYSYNQALNWSTWASWNNTEASQVWRPYNYVWVSALYWALYHAEQVSPRVLTLQNSSWYLEQASHTAQVWYGNTTDGEFISDFRDVGFMGETVWLELLKDLRNNLPNTSDVSVYPGIPMANGVSVDATADSMEGMSCTGLNLKPNVTFWPG
jgi:hypothetical protein